MSRVLRDGMVSLQEPVSIPPARLPKPAAKERKRAAVDACALLASARAQAEAIRGQAQKEARALYEQARAEGVAQGRRVESIRAARAAQEAVRRETERQQTQTRGVKDELQRQLARTKAAVRQEALAIGFSLAGHMLRVKIDPDAPQFSGLTERLFPTEEADPADRPTESDTARVQNGGDAVA